MRVLEVVDGVAVASGGVDDGEVEELVGCVELDEEVEDLVDGPVGACGGLVDLVDDDDDGEGEREGLLEDEVGLGHGAFLGVDEEECAVGHLEDTLDLAAEVGMSGGVDDVDGVVLVAEGAVLGGDGDAALALEVIGVHEALLDLLVVAEAAGELEESVDDGGLAVVDVRDDGDVADFVLLHVLRWGEGEGNRSAK